MGLSRPCCQTPVAAKARAGLRARAGASAPLRPDPCCLCVTVSRPRPCNRDSRAPRTHSLQGRGRPVSAEWTCSGPDAEVSSPLRRCVQGRAWTREGPAQRPHQGSRSLSGPRVSSRHLAQPPRAHSVERTSYSPRCEVVMGTKGPMKLKEGDAPPPALGARTPLGPPILPREGLHCVQLGLRSQPPPASFGSCPSIGRVPTLPQAAHGGGPHPVQ